MSKERQMEIEKLYHDQEIGKVLRALEAKIGHPIDVTYIRDEHGLVKLDSVKLVVEEGETPEHADLIVKVQADIRWWVQSAKGNVDFVDRSRLNLDEYVDRKDKLGR